MIDHIKLFVSDITRSRSFYQAALEPLGYRVVMEPAPTVLGLGLDRPDLWLAATDPDMPQPTRSHVAIQAESRERVDAFHRAAIEAGGTDNGGPGPRPQYHPGYYGAFVLDPDGNNIEAVCHRPED